MKFSFTSKIWLYPGDSANWHFITLPKQESEELKQISGPRRGWGSIRITATIGKTSWKTSIFPDTKAGAFLLPLKAEVRKKEQLKLNDEVKVEIEI